MMRWMLIFFGICGLLVLAAVLFVWLWIWSYEHDFPKSILESELKGACFVTQKPIVLLKSEAREVENRIYPLLLIPENVNYVYTEYVLGEVLADDGSELRDLSNTIEVPVGTRFILKDGLHDRTINSRGYYVYWMEPEGITLDSIYVYNPLAISKTIEEMAKFPKNDLFARGCDP